MRLIDADKLPRQKQIELMIDGEYKEVWVVHEEDIDNAPTIEAEPVIHGSWIIEPGIGLKCSNCGFDIGNDLDEYANYCPYCGAKMDKE